MVEINTKTDLLKEIEAFSKALYEYRNIGPLIISEKEYNPYYVENGYLKRADYSGVILDENAFLAFYAVFFVSIKLDSMQGKFLIVITSILFITNIKRNMKKNQVI